VTDVMRAARSVLRSEMSWPRGAVEIVALGSEIAVCTSEPEIREALLGLYSALLGGSGADHLVTLHRERAEQGEEFVLTIDAIRMLRDPAISVVFQHLLFEVNQLALTCNRSFVAVHAGAVAHDGTATILPGPMDAGKSTLTATLVERGADYLSDEVALIDPASQRVHPYAKYLALGAVGDGLFDHLDAVSAASRELRGDQRLVPPAAIGRVADRAVAPGFVIAPRFERDAPTRLEPLSAPDAVALLGAHTFRLDDDPERALGALGAVVAQARCFTLEYGDRAEAADVVLELWSNGAA
jgi:hypothetical protein